MRLILGNILYCKKDFGYSTDCYTKCDERYVLVRIEDDEGNIDTDGDYYVFEPLDNKFYENHNGESRKRTHIFFLKTEEGADDEDVPYIWKYFHTKLFRVKQIIKKYETKRRR